MLLSEEVHVTAQSCPVFNAMTCFGFLPSSVRAVVCQLSCMVLCLLNYWVTPELTPGHQDGHLEPARSLFFITQVFLSFPLPWGHTCKPKPIYINVRREQIKWATNTIKANLLFTCDWLFTNTLCRIGHALIVIIINISSREPACMLTVLHFHLTWIIATFCKVVLIVTIYLELC